MSESVAPSPRISIIVATYQAARTLERCLMSIVGQTFIAWELLISDGASTDGTVDIIRRYSRHIAYWHSHPDNGIYDAWNQALAHAIGEYVCFLGADDTWADYDTVARLFNAIGENAYDLVSSRGNIVDPSTGKQTIFGSAWDYRRIGRRMVICHPGMLHRRSLFERFGLFNTHYRIAGDLDFLLRLPRSIRTLYIDTTTVTIESAGISRRNVLRRLREQRDVLSHSKRYGPLRAYIVWIDKLWRYPLAHLFGISH